MPNTEKILISELVSDAIWQRLILKFAEYDVEAESEDEYVYDLRQGATFMEDEGFFWGRDGWSEGFWHARFFLERGAKGTLVLYAERGDDPRCMSMLALQKATRVFMHSCMSAREMVETEGKYEE